MISEVDIRDWEKIDIPHITKVLDNIDFENINPPQWEMATALEIFIRQVEQLKLRQLETYKKTVPALLRPHP